MTKEYGTIKIDREDFERHNEKRQDLGLTWAEYLDNQSPKHGIDREALAEDRQEQLEEVVYSACGDTATEESIAELAETLRKTQELIERVPEETAEQLERYR